MGSVSISNDNLTFRVIFQISFAHIGVSVGIVAVNSFLNSELRFQGWKPSIISIFLGTAILFEFSRLWAGKRFDQAKSIQLPLILSTFLIIFGIGSLSWFVKPIGNITIIVILGLFFIGSATVSTLVDTVLTVISTNSDRSKVAGILQTLRLTGFAIGGIVGAILYPRLSFNVFCWTIGILCGLTVLISSIKIFEIDHHGGLIKKNQITRDENSIKDLFAILKEPRPMMMTLFLLLYPLGLFMQDLILETFTIDNFNFSKDGVGRVVIIWSVLTLIFVPIGVYLENNYFSRRFLGLIGALIGSLGLILIAVSTIDFSFRLAVFIIGLVLFGIGNGLLSAPVIALMLDISAEQESFTALLLGFYGVILTLGRFNAAWIAGIILYMSGERYNLVFILEAVFLALTCIPIFKLTIDDIKHISKEDYPIFIDIS